MSNTAKRVGSAPKDFAKMAFNTVAVLAFTLILDFKCWQVCASHRSVPVTGESLAPVHRSCNLLSLWMLQAETLVERCLSLQDKASAIGQLEAASLAQWSKGKELVFLECCLPLILPVSQNLVLNLEMVPGLTLNNAATQCNRTSPSLVAEPIITHFGTFLGSANHLFSCVAHSTN